jgi:putative ATP-binding cassette transporter
MMILRKRVSTLRAMKELVEREAGRNVVYRLTGLCVLAGFFEAAVLIILNTAAQSAGDSSRSFLLLYYFIVAILIWFLVTRSSRYSICETVQPIISRTRLRVVEKAHAADLRSFEQLGYTELLVQFSDDMAMIVDASFDLAVIIGKSVVLLCCLAYIAYMSIIAALLVLVVLVGAALAYFPTMSRLWVFLEDVRERQKDIFTDIRHFLYGFKELKLSDKKSDDFFHRGFKVRSVRMLNARIKTGFYFTMYYVIAMVVWYLMLMMLAFALPAITPIQPDRIMVLILVILFMPLDIFMASLPSINRANVSMERIKLMERALDALAADTSVAPAVAPEDFSKIELEDVTFEYFEKPEDNMFSLGPIRCSIKKGEIFFITGGNGYGKSTLLKLICGLYRPKSGCFRMDGRVVSMESHRELFSAVFSDYHLFDRLYGLKDIDSDHVNALLKKMRIDHKTQYVDGRFTTLNLSTGQRKRLALVCSLIEDRPIYIFDEWAAGQDPSFRSYFYRELLRELKDAGKTIIVVTHDDRYFDVADRLFPLEFGRMA